MTSSQVVLFSVLCIPLSLFSYFFFSLPRVSRWVRTYDTRFIDIRLAGIVFVFYFCAFLVMEKIFFFFEDIVFPCEWQQSVFVFACLTGLLVFSFYCATGGLVIKAPTFYAERMILYTGDSSTLGLEAVKIITAQKGEILLELPEKNMVIAQLSLPEQVVVECSWQPLFLGNTLIQMVCYPASRNDSVNKIKLASLLSLFNFYHCEKK